MPARAVSIAAAWALRWGLLGVLWLALTDTVKPAELIAGAGAAGERRLPLRPCSVPA
jgi:hypothetical protein